MYVKAVNGQIVAFPYGPNEILRDNPQISFPWPMVDELMAQFDVYPVESRNPPPVDQELHYCERIDPVFEDGRWVEAWAIRDYTQEQINQRIIDFRSGLRLTFAQLMIGLVSQGFITEAEGEAWLTGTLPASVLALINNLPAEQKFPAKARAVRPSEVDRMDPLVIALGQANNLTDEQMDTFFQTFAQV